MTITTECISQQKNGVADYFLTDALGSVRQIANQSGSVAMGQAYDPFGNALGWSGLGESNYGYAGQRMVYLKAPFRFFLQCGVSYGARQSSDYAKLTELSSGGRSTDTTILSMSLIRQLRNDQELLPKARKLLSFTDNRQDASLQAGHFNDFVEIALLRSAMYRAVKAAAREQTGISHDVLTMKVFQSLDLPVEYYASDPEVRFAQKAETDRALREVLGDLISFIGSWSPEK